MLLNTISSYISGFVDVVVEGYYIEDFINLCINHDIYLWNISRIKDCMLYARVERKNFKELRHICRKTKCKMKIKRKRGFLFIIHRYRKRKIFALLFILFVLLMFFLSNFIWNIEITGQEEISEEEILTMVNDMGLKIGAWKYNIDTNEIINKLRLERDDISWVGISIDGTNATIEIAEADESPEIVDEEEYCNIVSDKEAMILKITAINGTSLVEEGDIVRKGDILIGGYLEGLYTGVRYVHAQGEIQAKVWYTVTKRIYLNETQKQETGNTETKYSININNFKINLYKGLSNFENYDTIEETKKLKLFADFYLPIEITTYTSKEYKNVQIVRTVQEAIELGKSEAESELNEKLKNLENLLDEQVVTYEEADYVDVEVTYEVQENIGTEEKIVF